MAAVVPQGMQPNTPTQISAEWWMAYAPSGHPYYHNTVTKETTWVAPDLTNASKALDQAALASYQQGAYGGCPQHPMQYMAAGQQSMQPMQPMHSMQSMHGMDSAQGMKTSYPTQGPVNTQTTAGTDGQPEITVQGSGELPSPWVQFDQVQLPRPLIEPMLNAGFKAPTPIQAHAWPILCAGRDIIGIAKTGSGKTLSFLLPGFARMLQERLPGGPIMLVMAPTRELAVQIDADAKRFAGPAGIQTALAYGGAPKGPQLADLRRRPHLLTGTPGRLNDFLEGRMINLQDVRFLVLDEADRMLDMGFEPQIRKVIAQVPSRRQTLMFTATWPKEVRRMAQDFFHNPVEVRIGNADELQANTDIEQTVIICNGQREKEQHVLNVLRTAPGQVIIFVGTKRMCDQLARSLERMGVKCEAIHGDRDQRSRDMALDSFKGGRAQVLVATDVAARGLDVKSIRVVLNFDPANNAEDYVHRIGRTGRAGVKGQAVTLLTREDGRAARQIAEVMQRTGKPVPPELDRLLAEGGFSSGGGKGGGRRRESPPRGGRDRYRPY